jgi:hypothetical protein
LASDKSIVPSLSVSNILIGLALRDAAEAGAVAAAKTAAADARTMNRDDIMGGLR